MSKIAVIQQGHFTVAILQGVKDGEAITSVGFSKYNADDANGFVRDRITGKYKRNEKGKRIPMNRPFNPQLGKTIAVNRALDNLKNGKLDFTVEELAIELPAELPVEEAPISFIVSDSKQQDVIELCDTKLVEELAV